jgi:hypothetical protein
MKVKQIIDNLPKKKRNDNQTINLTNASYLSVGLAIKRTASTTVEIHNRRRYGSYCEAFWQDNSPGSETGGQDRS